MNITQILKDIIEAFKNWLRDQQPELVPVPVHQDSKKNKSITPQRVTHVGVMLAVITFLAVPFNGFASKLMHPSQDSPKTILFLGDSITAGYGLDQSQAFPALIQERIDEKGLNYSVVNAGLSGETSSGGLRRIGWLLRSKVDILILELGANDGLRGIDLTVTKANLQKIIDLTRESNPDVMVIIAGMQVPPNLGQEYTNQFRNLFADLAKSNRAKLIPFILEGVAGEPTLNLSDGIHPNVEGHKILANNVWTVLSPVLN